MIDKLISTFDLKRSLSAKGTPLDNAVIEATNHILKTEFIYQEQFQTIRDLRVKLSEYIH